MDILQHFKVIFTALIHFCYFASNDSARTVYIGISTVIISVTIFSAEFIKSDKPDIEKKMLHKEIPVIRLIILVLFTLFIYFLKAIFFKFKYIYLVLAILTTSLEIYSIGVAFTVIFNTMNISMNATRFSEKMHEYIIDNTEKINKKDKDTRIIDNDINHNSQIKIFNNSNNIDKDKFKEIVADSNGMMLGIKRDIKNVGYETEILIKNLIGKYCKKGSVIGYYSINSKEKISADDIFIFDKNYISSKDAYEEIVDYLFNISTFIDSLDEDNKIYDYYSTVCERGYDEIEKMISNRIYEIYFGYKSKIDSIDLFISFVTRIKDVALLYKKSESYELLQGVICNYFFELIDNHKEITEKIQFLYMYRLSKLKDKKHKYYDTTMASLLDIFLYLIKKEKYSDVCLLINEYSYMFNIEDEAEQIRKINLCFLMGIVKAVFYLYFHNRDHKNEYMNILNTIKDNFYIFDGSEIIFDYLYIIKNKTKIGVVLDYCWDRFEEHRPGIIYDVINIKEMDFLMIFLDVMNAVFFDKRKPDYFNENKNDKFRFEEMGNIYKKGKITYYFVDYLLHFNKNTNFYDEYLRDILGYYKHLEEEYIENTEIDPKVQEKFVEELNNESLTNNMFYKYMLENNKITFNEKKPNSKYVLKAFISRDFFFKNGFPLEQLVDNIHSEFLNIIFSMYCEKIKNTFDTYTDIADFPTEKGLTIINSDLYYKYYYSRKKEIDVVGCIPSRFIEGFIFIPIDKIPNLCIISHTKNETFVIDKNVIFTDLSKDNDRRKKESKNIDEEKKLKGKMLIEIKIKINIQL